MAPACPFFTHPLVRHPHRLRPLPPLPVPVLFLMTRLVMKKIDDTVGDEEERKILMTRLVMTKIDDTVGDEEEEEN